MQFTPLYSILLKSRSLPTWMVLAFDLLLSVFTLFFAYLLRFNFKIPAIEIQLLPQALLCILIIRLITYTVFKVYAGIVRYTSTEDAVRIFLVVFLGSSLVAIVNIISFYFINNRYIVPFSIIIIDFVLTLMVLLGYRVLIKLAFLEVLSPNRLKKRVLIYGAGEAGIITKRALDRDAGTKYKVVGFIDDDTKKSGKTIEGVPIFDSSMLQTIINEREVEHLILAIQNIEAERKKQIIETCLHYNISVLNVPPVNRWINGELSFKQIRNVRIEDLLEREVIQLDNSELINQLNNKTILITGAAGSIGSEIVRQLINYTPKRLVLLDNAETPLYQIDLEIDKYRKSIEIEIVMGDIRNASRMERLFSHFKPEIVYHAAAYKHVPMMENNPAEAVFTNINGTKIIADLALTHKVSRFVFVSTDKAVNPTNVMGASKRIAEIYIQSLNILNQTRFITTRFGNVLGSNGSVIPLFKKQIENGMPLTVTHPEVTRYFMTIPEACQLVLEAGAMGKGGEIFIFDMGKSVKILDLAKRMIQLSGLELGKDISIVFTGLRPGEKLYEELLNNQENTIPTYHPRILIAKVREYQSDDVNQNIHELLELLETQDNQKIVGKMKAIVPEFISNNSEFQALDQAKN